MSKHILIVEDESELAETVAYNLSLEGFTSTICTTGTAGLNELQASPPDLILLDLMLPDLSGVEVCRRVRANQLTNHIPIIMVTARGEEIDRVVGFEVGADDYVVKPFSARELMLRVKAMFRRGVTPAEAGNVIHFECFRIDKGAHRAWIDEEEITLTALEFKLLVNLIESRGRVQTREALLQEVWNMDPNVNTRTVDKHVQRLRQKIEAGAAFIETIRGVGYRFRAEP